MRPVGRAKKLERATQANLIRLGRLLDAASSGAWDRLSEDVVSYVAIEAQNTWHNFARAYYLSCFIGTRLSSGLKVGTNPMFPAASLADAQGHAINRFRQKKKRADSSGKWDPRDEPAWFNPDTLLTLCADLRCSNLASVQASLSPVPQVFESLPAFRHFFAHRNQSTTAAAVLKASGLGLPTTGGPAAALVFRPPTVPRAKLSQWLVDMGDVARSLCA